LKIQVAKLGLKLNNMEYNTSDTTGNKIQTPRKKRGVVKKEMDNQLEK